MEKIKNNKAKSTTKSRAIGELSKILDKKGVYTVVTKPEDYLKVNLELIRHLSVKYLGIYLTLSELHCNLVEKLKNEKNRY